MKTIIYSFILSLIALISYSEAQSKLMPDGRVSATMYYLPEVHGTIIQNKGNIVTVTNLGSGEQSDCVMEGGCIVIERNGKRNLIAFDKSKKRGIYSARVPAGTCPHGIGSYYKRQVICLEPFYTLAADLKVSQQKAGTVVFIPALKGIKLPNGDEHDGYFIIRDSGKGIKGVGRFDFYTGKIDPYDKKKNPFSDNELHLGDKKVKILNYFIIPEEPNNPNSLAETIRKKHNFPFLPDENSRVPSSTSGTSAITK